MYTQCPQCHTIFALTQTQLDVRGGMVRCGKCRHAFRGDHYMFDTLPDQIEPSAPTTKPLPRTAAANDDAVASTTSSDGMEDSRIPTVSDLSWMRAQRPRHTAKWAAASFLLLLTLAGQYIYLNRYTWPDRPLIKTALTYYCDTFACDLPALHDIAAIELAEVEIAPHPQFEAMLQVQALLINRARFPQPYPGLEIGFTDNQGVTVARRTFAAKDYLAPRTHRAAQIAPDDNVAIVLALTQPSADAVGYEIHLVSAR